MFLIFQRNISCSSGEKVINIRHIFSAIGVGLSIVSQGIVEIGSFQVAYCPHCRTVTNMRVDTTLLNVNGMEENAEIIAVRTYHCGSCGLFVRSEEGCSISLLQ